MKKIFFLLLVSVFLSCSSESKENLLSLFVITEDLELGENRVVLTALDVDGNTLTDDLRFFIRELESENKVEITDKTISNWPPNRKVFVTNLNFDKTGYWEYRLKKVK